MPFTTIKAKRAYLLFCYLFSFLPNLKAQSVQILDHNKACSIRGLSIVNNKTAWVSGSNGFVGITTNGGETWAWAKVKGFEHSDFRDIEAFSQNEAIIMSSGTPALILRTTDRGLTWQTCYQNDDKNYFFDAMTFINKSHGFVLGDPINGKFLIMKTRDGGNTWRAFKNPPVSFNGEAAFAASGTCIIANSKMLCIVTGGSKSRDLILLNPTAHKPNNWLSYTLPLLKGQNTQGTFSTVIKNGRQIFVGGDYQNNKRKDSVACYFDLNDSKSMSLAAKPPEGYQSSVESISRNIFISTGTSGTNITFNRGRTWKLIDSTSYNVCKKAKGGKLILLAGDNGKIGKIKISNLTIKRL